MNLFRSLLAFVLFISIVACGDDEITGPFTVDQNFTIEENAANGTYVGKLVAASGSNVTFSFKSGNDQGIFNLEAASGVITVADSSGLDYETNPEFNLVVEAQDESSQKADMAVLITLADVIPTTDDLMAYYSFDGNALNQLRASLASDTTHGKVTAATIQANDHGLETDSVYYFNGAAYINFGTDTIFDLGKFDDWTLSVWVKQESSAEGGAIFSKYWSTEGLSYSLSTTRSGDEYGVNFTAFVNNSEVSLSSSITADQWQHILIKEEDNSTLTMFVQGDQVNQLVLEDITIMQYDTVPAIMGAYRELNSAYDNGFTGQLDDLRLYNAALSDADCRTIFTEE